MPRTAQALIQELAERQGDFVLATPTAAGTTTTLIDSVSLAQYLPTDTSRLYAWVYGRQNVTALNRGAERRSNTWDVDTFTLSVAPFPAPINTEGEYELHLRTRRRRKLVALNEAAGTLFLYWYREFRDTSLTTTVNTWQYFPPLSANWAKINKIEIQVNTAQASYPYRELEGWEAIRNVDQDGNVSWLIQFQYQPPVDRILRIYGEGFFPDLVADNDVLALAGEWEQAAQSFVMDHAEYRIAQWEANVQTSDQIQITLRRAKESLDFRQRELLAQSPSRKPARLITPESRRTAPWSDPSYLAAFRSAAQQNPS